MKQHSLAFDRLDADSLLSALSRHIGKHNGISVTDLVYAATGQPACAASERRCRQIIHDLRMQGQHICSHPSTGYYMAANEAELNAACSYLYDRAMSSLQQISAMKRVAMPDLKGQLRLPD